MIIGITGHTSGIGKSINDWFQSKGHIIKGFSRSNGYNIVHKDDILESLIDCDVFINNAYYEWAQTELLYSVYDMWKELPKTIINISSNSSDGIKNFRHSYAIHKASLDKATEQLQNTKPICRIMNIKPGYVDTPRVKHITGVKKLSPDYVAEVVGWMFEQSCLVKSLTIE